ncbi:MAG: hypothetical protein ACI88L_000566 [Candidatus Paceibacteria bacterium]|jgi:hypothetical protein
MDNIDDVIEYHPKVKELAKIAKDLGFTLMTKEGKEKEGRLLKLDIKPTRRILEARNQISFWKETYGHTIKIHTSYNPNGMSFNKTGRISLPITRLDTKSPVYMPYFYRKLTVDGSLEKYLIKKIAMEMEFEIIMLKLRPIDSLGDLMFLRESSDCIYEWYSLKTEETKSLWYDIELAEYDGVREYVLAQKESKKHYQRNRKNLGVKTRSRDVRDTGNTKVPVIV